MISDTLIPMLQKRFADRGVCIETQPRTRVIFPAAHPEVGDILVYDDGDEITIYAGNFTHGHFSNDDDISEEEKAKLISTDVVDFLDAVFSDNVAFWGSHRSGGGWRWLDSGTTQYCDVEYVWSGPRHTVQ